LFSVIIPAYRRPAGLVRCLEALCAQTLSRSRFEVVVCDDGSPEPLAPFVAPFADRLALVVVGQANAGPATARNHAARRARGAVLAFTDDDCIPAPDWLERLAARFERDPDRLVGGAMMNALPGDVYATATQLLMDSVYEYYGQHSAGRRFYSTANLAVPAGLFRQLGGFSEDYPDAAGEDYDFCARWSEHGFSTGHAPEAIVGHAHGHDLRSFWKQHLAYGRALLRVRRGVARRAGHRTIRVEPARFYVRLLSRPVRRGRGWRRWQLAALVLLSQIATAAGAVWELFATVHSDWKGSAHRFAGRFAKRFAAGAPFRYGRGTPDTH
jgi:GT2 family glycosyltransferase